MDKDAALALISSISVVAGLFVALLLTRLESWRADASAAAARVRATQTGAFNDREEALRAELHCWEVADDAPLQSSLLVDAVVAVSALASYFVARSVSELAVSALALAAPAGAVLLLLVLAQVLFIRRGSNMLAKTPYATFKQHP